MSWTRFLFLGDYGQQLDLEDHNNRLRTLGAQQRTDKRRDDKQDDRLRTLEQEVMQLEAALAALASLLRDKGVANDQEIAGALDRAVAQAEQAAADKAKADAELALAEQKAAAERKAKLAKARRRR